MPMTMKSKSTIQVEKQEKKTYLLFFSFSKVKNRQDLHEEHCNGENNLAKTCKQHHQDSKVEIIKMY
ncbi:43985_t:CDS:2 [Gigaspora margarita]|uniref:43985_t:CDS:1 n=1 Tax=Gigaspora margarita TaxID=4874 RepID=A0ABN7UBS7_GIGMA|nr:43985_t:CDS:2 [Gigaspora margarita]